MSRLVGVKEAAEYLDLSQRMIYYLVSRGEIAHVRVGASIKFTIDQLDSFVESRSVDEL